MELFRGMQDIYAWKREDLEAVRSYIREAVASTPAHGTMRNILLECAGNPGKMIRPLMILLAAGDHAPDKRDMLLWTAAATEMMHMASLLLDDVLDGAAVRRGRPSVSGMHGDAIAMCAGNYLVATAYATLCDHGCTDIARSFMTVAQAVCDGEMLQDEHRWDTELPESVYLRSASGKTASVFAAACEISSRITGQPGRTQDAMRRFGETAGLLFQIRDDILDWTMDERELGKPAGGDFANGIYTLPVIRAFQSARHGESLRNFAARRQSLRPEELAEVRHIVEESGGIDCAREAARKLAETADALLDPLPPSIYVSALRMLVRAFAL